MTKVAYLECPTGIAGDMCLGALVHAGVPLDYLTEQLARLGVASEYRLWSELVHRNAQQATRVHVDVLVDRSAHSDSLHAGLSHTHSSHAEAAQGAAHVHPHAPEKEGIATVDRVTLAQPFTGPELSRDRPHHHPEPHPEPHPESAGRHLPDIEQLILAAHLPKQAEAWSLAIFRQLAAAEGAVHGIAPDRVHFHEVGAIDAIVDIVGTCLGLDWLAIDALYCSPLPIGGGTVRAAHGLLPVPAPAVLKLWEMRQIPVYSNGIERELVTPTGAAITTTLATRFGPPPAMTLHRIGLGAGSRDLAIPNILRLWLGETDRVDPDSTLRQFAAPLSPIQEPVSLRSSAQETAQETVQETAQETVIVLETQIDDLNPQAIGYVFEALFAVGALDVFTQAIGMKKSRPGILLTVICGADTVAACESVLFQETTTLGIRRSNQQRTVLHREIQSVDTQYGAVRIKVARRSQGGNIVNAQPEYEDCAQLARQFQLPWRDIHSLALYSWQQTMKP